MSPTILSLKNTKNQSKGEGFDKILRELSFLKEIYPFSSNIFKVDYTHYFYNKIS